MLVSLSSGAVLDLAHALHYGIVLAGLAGVVALLAPAVAVRWLPAGPAPAYDEHQRRVLELRARITAGNLATPPAGLSSAPAVPARTRPGEAVLPVVLVSSAAAAGVHAAVTPAHVPAGTLVAGFFVIVALAQLGWTARTWSHPSSAALRTGALGNAALVAVWALSRTAGVPGVAPTEAVGPWDVAAVCWELVVVAGSLTLLSRAGPARTAAWHPAATWWLGASVVVLGTLSVSGAAA